MGPVHPLGPRGPFITEITEGRHWFTKSGARPVRSRKAVVDEDLVLFYTQGKESVAWAGEILVVRRVSDIADLHSGHLDMVCSNPPFSVHLIVRVLRTWSWPAILRAASAGFRSTVIDRLAGVRQSAMLSTVRMADLVVTGAAVRLNVGADGLAELGDGLLVTSVVGELADASTDHKICALQRRHEL